MDSIKGDDSSSLSEATLAVHGGTRSSESAYGALVSPVFHSSTYKFSSFEEMRRYARGELPDAFFYSRYANPTVAEVERKIADLEHAEACVVTSSGSAAAFCTLAALCESGDEVIACDSIYGGTVKLLTKILSRWGVRVRFVSLDEVEQLPTIAGERSKAFWFETPANPINRVLDLGVVSEVTRRAGIHSIIDNTFATPILQRPLDHGIDATMHSATKYLGGHSDLTAGAVAGRRDFIDRVRELSILIGTTLDPAAAYLLNRGIKTLGVRVKASSQNALKLAQALERHPKVARVYYPGLEKDPGHEVARRQMNGFGGVVAMDLVGGEPEAERLFDAFKLVSTAPSLGGVETLVSYPLYSSHVGFSDEQLKAAGVSAATVRFAVGIEAAEDIIADVEQALSQI
jgi:cystathionine beta-lyase/cystathionine gamma-synthase